MLTLLHLFKHTLFIKTRNMPTKMAMKNNWTIQNFLSAEPNIPIPFKEASGQSIQNANGSILPTE